MYENNKINETIRISCKFYVVDPVKNPCQCSRVLDLQFLFFTQQKPPRFQIEKKIIEYVFINTQIKSVNFQ